MARFRDGVHVHPSAVVSEEASLAAGVWIGPSCVVEGRVCLGENVRLVGSVHLNGPLTIGSGTIVYPFACLGFSAQDYKFKPGDPTPGVAIGSGCIIREHVTVHAPTRQDRQTRIGDNVFMMVGVHAAHDVQVGNNVVVVNAAVFGGHVEVGERANIGGHAGIHQFVRIGRLAMVGGNCTMTTDVPPFCIVAERNTMFGLNAVGLRRSGVPRSEITLLRAVYREVMRVKRSRPEIIEGLRRMGGGNALVEELAAFYLSSKRGVALSSALPPRQFRSWLRRAHELTPSTDGHVEGEGDEF